MLTKSNIIKAAVLSLLVAFVSISFQIFSATRIHQYNQDIDWSVVDKMSYSEAREYLEANSHTITGVEAITKHITEPVFWSGSLLDIMLEALGYFISFMVLLVWVGRKKQPNQSLNTQASPAGTPQDGAH